MSELAPEKLPETIELRTKDNYKTWRMKAEALLNVSDLWDYVSGDIKIPSENEGEQKSWKIKDKRAKSMLILNMSDSLLPLVEDCKTSEEIWLKLENLYGNKGDSIERSEIDEDTIINDIEESVDDFFETINDPIVKEEKSLKLADELLLRLKKNGSKKLPDKKIIADIVDQFITDVIEKLSETEIKEKKIELSGKLIDDLLVEFDINPHKNDNDDATSNVATPEKETDSRERGDYDTDRMNHVLLKLPIHALPENTIANNDHLLQLSPLHESTRIKGELFCEQGDCGTYPLPNLYTPPASPSPRRARKCGVCRREGHNRTTCPLNKPVTSAPKSAARSTPTPTASRKCGICRIEGHNRTTCSLNKTVSPASKTSSQTVSTPSRSYSCGICGGEGHNRTTCSLNRTVSPASKSSSQTVSTPSRSYSCGICGGEGHNRTTCSLNKTVSPASKSSSQTVSTPSRSYSCGICGGEGHNRTTCSLNRTIPSPSQSLSRSVSSTPSRSYCCGVCGIEGHNRTTCPSLRSNTPSPRSYATSTPVRSYSCGTCGGQGHNSRTCSAGRSSSSSYSYAAPPPTYSYAAPSPSYSGGPRRTYTCGNCGGSGHNSRTCSG